MAKVPKQGTIDAPLFPIYSQSKELDHPFILVNVEDKIRFGSINTCPTARLHKIRLRIH